MIVNTEPCCYGFFHASDVDEVDGRWECGAQRPFRGHWLWLWGSPDALMTSLQIGAGEQLLLDGVTPRGLPFGAMRRNVSVTPSQFMAFVHGEWPSPGRVRLEGAVASPVLASSFGAPHLVLPTASVGQAIRFGFSGTVRGVVLVGEQLK